MPSIVTPFGEAFQLVLGDVAEGAGAILADHGRPRQLELALEFAVVGQQQQALGHIVEAAHRHHARKPGGSRS